MVYLLFYFLKIRCMLGRIFLNIMKVLSFHMVVFCQINNKYDTKLSLAGEYKWQYISEHKFEPQHINSRRKEASHIQTRTILLLIVCYLLLTSTVFLQCRTLIVVLFPLEFYILMYRGTTLPTTTTTINVHVLWHCIYKTFSLISFKLMKLLHTYKNDVFFFFIMVVHKREIQVCKIGVLFK